MAGQKKRREHFPIHDIGRIDGGRGFRTGGNVLRIGGNTFYDRKNKIPMKIPEFKRLRAESPTKTAEATAEVTAKATAEVMPEATAEATAEMAAKATAGRGCGCCDGQGGSQGSG